MNLFQKKRFRDFLFHKAQNPQYSGIGMERTKLKTDSTIKVSMLLYSIEHVQCNMGCFLNCEILSPVIVNCFTTHNN